MGVCVGEGVCVEIWRSEIQCWWRIVWRVVDKGVSPLVRDLVRYCGEGRVGVCEGLVGDVDKRASLLVGVMKVVVNVSVWARGWMRIWRSECLCECVR